MDTFNKRKTLGCNLIYFNKLKKYILRGSLSCTCRVFVRHKGPSLYVAAKLPSVHLFYIANVFLMAEMVLISYYQYWGVIGNNY